RTHSPSTPPIGRLVKTSRLADTSTGCRQRVSPSYPGATTPPTGTLGDTEQQRFAIGRPRFRDVGHVLVGFRQTFRRAGAVGALPEEAEIPLAVRLKRDALAVGGPDRKTIATAQRAPPHLRDARP